MENAVVKNGEKIFTSKYGAEIASAIAFLAEKPEGIEISYLELTEVLKTEARGQVGMYLLGQARKKLCRDHSQLWVPFKGNGQHGLRRLAARSVALLAVEKDIPSIRRKARKSLKVSKIAVEQYDSLSSGEKQALNLGVAILGTLDQNLSRSALIQLGDRVQLPKLTGPDNVKIDWVANMKSMPGRR